MWFPWSAILRHCAHYHPSPMNFVWDVFPKSVSSKANKPDHYVAFYLQYVHHRHQNFRQHPAMSISLPPPLQLPQRWRVSGGCISRPLSARGELAFGRALRLLGTLPLSAEHRAVSKIFFTKGRKNGPNCKEEEKPKLSSRKCPPK